MTYRGFADFLRERQKCIFLYEARNVPIFPIHFLPFYPSKSISYITHTTSLSDEIEDNFTFCEFFFLKVEEFYTQAFDNHCFDFPVYQKIQDINQKTTTLPSESCSQSYVGNLGEISEPRSESRPNWASCGSSVYAGRSRTKQQCAEGAGGNSPGILSHDGKGPGHPGSFSLTLVSTHQVGQTYRSRYPLNHIQGFPI